MRVVLVITGLFVCAVLSGCSRSGDVSTFVVSEVAKHGGHTVTNPALPVIDARWTIERDDNGFTARVAGAPFASIDAAMLQAFGPPKVSVDSNSSGHPHRVWAAVDIGVAIQLIGRPDGAEIICVRGTRDMGEMLHTAEERR